MEPLSLSDDHMMASGSTDVSADTGDTNPRLSSEKDVLLLNANKEITKLREEIRLLSNELKKKDELLTKFTDTGVQQSSFLQNIPLDNDKVPWENPGPGLSCSTPRLPSLAKVVVRGQRQQNTEQVVPPPPPLTLHNGFVVLSNENGNKLSPTKPTESTAMKTPSTLNSLRPKASSISCQNLLRAAAHRHTTLTPPQKQLLMEDYPRTSEGEPLQRQAEPLIESVTWLPTNQCQDPPGIQTETPAQPTVSHPCETPGADIPAVDSTKGKCAQDWTMKIGYYETMFRLRGLSVRPKAQQFHESFERKEKVAKAKVEKTPREKKTQRIIDTFGFKFPRDPQDNGALDRMVRITTSIHSPLISTGCRPLCPTSPPEVGKRRLAVTDLLKKHSDKDLEESLVYHSNGSVSHIIPSIHSAEAITAKCCVDTTCRGSTVSLASTKVTSTCIQSSMARRNRVFPCDCVPEITLSRPPDATPKKVKRKEMDKRFLQPPKWRYEEIRKEKKKKSEKESKRGKTARETQIKETKAVTCSDGRHCLPKGTFMF